MIKSRSTKQIAIGGHLIPIERDVPPPSECYDHHALRTMEPGESFELPLTQQTLRWTRNLMTYARRVWDIPMSYRCNKQTDTIRVWRQ